VQATKEGVLNEVARLSDEYGTMKAKATGHSLGGALANLYAIDLVKAGYEVNMYNFGQPRVGNKAYAAYASGLLKEQYRHTNYKDIVPHVPA
jgi:triacylglycerol lipase